jgi:hypothetical protein
VSGITVEVCCKVEVVEVATGEKMHAAFIGKIIIKVGMRRISALCASAINQAVPDS